MCVCVCVCVGVSTNTVSLAGVFMYVHICYFEIHVCVRVCVCVCVCIGASTNAVSLAGVLIALTGSALYSPAGAFLVEKLQGQRRKERVA